jgi:hypothetical protein
MVTKPLFFTHFFPELNEREKCCTIPNYYINKVIIYAK